MRDTKNSAQDIQSSSASVSLWYPSPKPRHNCALRLICFPYAGGGPPVFRDWPDAFDSSIELRAAQLPGRTGRLREQRFESMPPLIDALVAKLSPLLDRPFAFFGHSVGAIIAFEVARQLRGREAGPSHLFVSGNIAPDLPYPSHVMHELPDRDFLAELRHLNGMPQAMLDSQELLEIILPIVRSDFKLLETYEYRPQAVLTCPILAFGGLRDPRTSREGLEHWCAQTSGAFDLLTLPGDHFFLDTARPALVQSIARKLLEPPPAVAGPRTPSR